MAYEKTIWKNREVEKPRTYTIQNNPDGTVTLIPAEGQIIEAGTPIIAANMNNIEEGIEAAHALTALDVGAAAFAPTVIALTSDTTLTLTHAGCVLTISSTSARTLTIPTNASVAFPIGTEIAIININTGALNIAPVSGVTLQSEGSKTKITKQYASAALKKTATNTWILVGNINS